MHCKHQQQRLRLNPHASIDFKFIVLLTGAVELALFASVASSAADKTPAGSIFVATNGNDGWSGLLSEPNAKKSDGPLATIAQGLKAIREKQAQPGPKPQRNILVRQGNYFLREPLVVTPADSGLSITAYQNEPVIISGGQLIHGWKQVSRDGKNLWRTEVGTAGDGNFNFRELWVNGKRAVRARHPNKGYLEVAELPDKAADWTQGHSRFRYNSQDLKASDTLTNAEVIVMTRWVESRLPMKAIDENERIVSFTKRSVFELAPKDLYYVEGAFEFLDQPGEWCFDRATGTLWYFPRNGETMEKAEAISPVLAQVLRLEGRPESGQFVEKIVLKGLTFSHTEWCFPEGFASGKDKVEIDPAPKPEVGGFGQAAIGVPGAVLGNGLRDCTFQNCTFKNLGTYALELRRGCQRNRIIGCEFANLGAGGIKIGETGIRASAEELTRENEITDCDIHDGGRMFHSAIGVWVGQSPGNRITHNHIHDFYYTGISSGWTWGYGTALATNNTVAFNHVHHIGVQSDGDGPILSDMAGIYTLGKQSGSTIINNLWHDIAGLRYGGWGIYFDEGTTGILANSNIVYRTTHGGFHQHYGATNTVCNNIFAFARDQQLQRTRTEPHISFNFETNIVYFNTGVLFGSDWSGDQFKVDHNLYFDTRASGEPDNIKLGPMTWSEWRAKGHDVHSLVADPLFAAPSTDDFSIKRGSPAFQIGFNPIDLSQVGIRKRQK